MTTERPNFLLIMPDQQRQDSLGCYGNTFVKTPNLDRLSRNGVTFDSAFTPWPVCTPARATMWTGLYPHAHGVIYNRYAINDVFKYDGKVEPIFRTFKNAGYTTAYYGKWHLGEIDEVDRFDIWEGFNSHGGHWQDGFDPHEDGKYRSEKQTESCIEFLRSQSAKDQPFLMVQGYYPPHNPYTAPREFQQIYADRGIPFPNYYAAVSALDHYTGQILDALEAEGLLENTVVMYFSDHGETFNYREFTPHKYVCHEESIRVPLIISQPGTLLEGKRVSKMVGLQDLAPTLLHMAGLEAPYPMHGHNLSPLLLGEQTTWRECFYVQNEKRTVRTPQRCIRTEEVKLVLSGDEQHQLYHLQLDPGEELNLFSPPKNDKHKEYGKFPDQTSTIIALSEKLRKSAEEIDDLLGVQMADRVIQQKKYLMNGK